MHSSSSSSSSSFPRAEKWMVMVSFDGDRWTWSLGDTAGGCFFVECALSAWLGCRLVIAVLQLNCSLVSSVPFNPAWDLHLPTGESSFTCPRCSGGCVSSGLHSRLDTWNKIKLPKRVKRLFSTLYRAGTPVLSAPRTNLNRRLVFSLSLLTTD